MHRLCLALGKTRRQLLVEADWAEIEDWRTYEQLEPWGESRADVRQAVQLHYLLSPYLPEDAGDPPALVYPYFEDQAEADLELQQAQENYRRLEAEWAAVIRVTPPAAATRGEADGQANQQAGDPAVGQLRVAAR